MFNTSFPFYGVMIFIAVIANIIVTNILSCKYNYSIFEYINLVLYEMIGIIIGAKVFSYIVQYNNHSKFDIFSIGMSSYGAIIGAIIMIFIFSFIYNKSFKELLYIIIPPIPLLYGIGKIGCFIAGCCRGFEYYGIGNVTYKYIPDIRNLSFFPIQLVESIVFILIFIYLIRIINKNKYNLFNVGNTFIICGLSKFILDFFRISHAGKLLSINQVFSLIFILIGFIIRRSYKNSYIKEIKRKPKKMSKKELILLVIVDLLVFVFINRFFPITLIISFIITNYIYLRFSNKIMKALYYTQGIICFIVMIMIIMSSMALL